MIPIRAIIKNGFWGIPVFFLLSCDGIQNDPLFLKWKNEKAGLLAFPDSIYFSIAAGDTTFEYRIAIQDSCDTNLKVWMYHTHLPDGARSYKTRKMSDSALVTFSGSRLKWEQRMESVCTYARRHQLYYGEKTPDYLRLGFPEERDLIIARNQVFLPDFRAYYEQSEIEFGDSVWFFTRKPPFFERPE